MLYSQARYYHYEDVDKDIEQLIKLTYNAITKKEIKLLAPSEIRKLSKELDRN